MFHVSSSNKNCLSPRCASAANVVCKDVEVFETKRISLNNFDS
jgi:hypothetical protein